MRAITHPGDGSAEILDPADPDDARRLNELRADPTTAIVDTLTRQQEALHACLPRPDDPLLEEPSRWVHLPWRRTVVHLLGPTSFRRVRLDRNRNKITLAEQEQALTRVVGVVGLSVGHAIAHTVAMEGLAGTLRLADHDELDLGNLNRVPATVLEIGVNKALVVARRIAEIDPYLRVEVLPAAIDSATITDFLDGLDVVMEECDSFAAKVLIRRHARAHGIPVLCETSDGGVLDVERFDLTPDRPLFHGLLDGLDTEQTLDPASLIAAAATFLDARSVTSRMGASVLEIGRTLSTWPQLGGDVALGGATCAAALRRLLCGEPLPSGRVRIDLDGRLDDIADPLADAPTHTAPVSPPPDPVTEFASLSDLDAIVYAGAHAASAVSLHPWRIATVDSTVVAAVDPGAGGDGDEVTRRRAALALGAVARNMTAAAAARGIPQIAEIGGPEDAPTVRLTVGASRTLSPGDRTALPTSILARPAGRLPGDRAALSEEQIALAQSLSSAAARIRVVTDRDRIDRLAVAAGADARVRYLTPRLHAEMLAAAVADTGELTAEALGLPPSAQALLPLFARPDVMGHLGAWEGGRDLGAATAHAVASSSALVVVTAAGWSVVDFIRAGDVARAVWIALTGVGLAVHPTDPVTGCARDDAERRSIAPDRGDELVALDRGFREALDVGPDEPVARVFSVVHPAAVGAAQ
ncbi:Rv1355c family protein [Williamsia sp. SKLECPSW1]